MRGIRTRKDFRFRSTSGLGADVTAIGRYRRPRNCFSLTLFLPGERKHRQIECTNRVIRTNVITVRFSEYAKDASKAELLLGQRGKEKQPSSTEYRDARHFWKGENRSTNLGRTCSSATGSV